MFSSERRFHCSLSIKSVIYYFFSSFPVGFCLVKGDSYAITVLFSQNCINKICFRFYDKEKKTLQGKVGT